MVLLSRGRWVACGWLSRIVRGWVCGLLFPPYVQVQLVAGQGDLDVLAARVDAGDLGLDHQGVAFWFLDAEPRVQIPVKEAPDRLGHVNSDPAEQIGHTRLPLLSVEQFKPSIR